MNKNEIFNELCEFGVKLTGIDIRYAKGRREEYVRMRAAIMVILINYYGVTTTLSGHFFNLDHTTAVHHKANHPWRYKSDDEYAYLYDEFVKYVLLTKRNQVDLDMQDILDNIKMIS